MEILETILHSFVNLAMLLFEYIGVGVITFAGLQGLVNYLRRSPDTRLTLAQGLAMGLEFKLGSEILRTVIVRSLSEIAHRRQYHRPARRAHCAHPLGDQEREGGRGSSC